MSDFPNEVTLKIVKKGSGLAVVDANASGTNALQSILVKHGGKLKWTCDLGPWEVQIKEGGPNPFSNQSKKGVKGGPGETKSTKMAGPPARLQPCGFSVAVWEPDPAKPNGGTLYLLDPDIVIGPPA